MRRSSLVLVVLAMFLAACGGSTSPAAPTAAPAATDAPAITPAPATTPPAVPTDAPASLVPGSIGYRVVNLSDGAVDVYVRTQGLVEAFPGAGGVAPGSVSTTVYPPDPGTVVVLRAGETNATCVNACGFLAESSTNFGEGDGRTIVVRNDGATEYWENPKPETVGTASNAIGPADPGRALLIAEAQGVTDGGFGMRVAYAGRPGCQADAAASGFILGGTVVLSYALDAPSVDVTIHGNQDTGCTAAPAGGPFTVAGAAGSRTFLFLWGTMSAMRGLVVPIP